MYDINQAVLTLMIMEIYYYRAFPSVYVSSTIIQLPLSALRIIPKYTIMYLKNNESIHKNDVGYWWLTLSYENPKWLINNYDSLGNKSGKICIVGEKR